MTLAAPLALKKLLSLPVETPTTDGVDAPQDIVLGAPQYPNPDGLQPRWDTDGPPPTRMPQGTKLSAPRSGGTPQMDASSPEPAQIIPGLLRAASTTAIPQSVKRLFGPAVNPADQTAAELASGDRINVKAEAPLPDAPTLPAMVPSSATSPADVAAATPVSADAAKPTLSQQGSSHAVPAALLQLMGITAPSPKPGELYTGPTTLADKIRAGIGFAAKLGNASAAAAGTPQQQEIAEKRAEFGPTLAANTELKKAQLESLGDYRQGRIQNAADQVAVNQQKTDQANQQASAKMRARGYVPDEQTPGTFRAMSADEILADPVLSQKQDLAQAASIQKNAEAALAQAHRDAILNPDNPVFAQKERQIQAQLKMAQANLTLRQHALANSDTSLDLRKRIAEVNYFSGVDPETGNYFTADENGESIPLSAYRTIGPSTQSRSRADAGRAIHPLIENARKLLGQTDPQTVREAADAATQAMSDPSFDTVVTGPVEGRILEAEQRLGNMPRKARDLAGTLISIYSLGGTMHGWRALQVAQEFQRTYGGLEATPDSLAGGLDAMDATAKSVERVGSVAHAGVRRNIKSAPSGGPPAANGAKLYLFPDGKKRAVVPDMEKEAIADGAREAQ